MNILLHPTALCPWIALVFATQASFGLARANLRNPSGLFQIFEGIFHASPVVVSNSASIPSALSPKWLTLSIRIREKILAFRSGHLYLKTFDHAD